MSKVIKPKTVVKLTRKDFERMWGEEGPYSQVRLCEEARILDGSVSRVFLVVEAEINPFTFEFVQKHRRQFVGDEPVLQLLDHAEYRGKFGYVVAAGEVQLEDKGSRRFAREQADMTIQTIIRMHEFVMDECGLRHDAASDEDGAIMEDDHRFVWNAATGTVEPAGDALWDDKTFIGSPAGARGNKLRFFIVFAFDKRAVLNKESAAIFAKTLKAIAGLLGVVIEECEGFHEYVLITALLPFAIAPADFIEAAIDGCNAMQKKPMFQKDYFVTNVEKPTVRQIMSFLAQLPLGKGKKTKLL